MFLLFSVHRTDGTPQDLGDFLFDLQAALEGSAMHPLKKRIALSFFHPLRERFKLWLNLRSRRPVRLQNSACLVGFVRFLNCTKGMGGVGGRFGIVALLSYGFDSSDMVGSIAGGL